MVIVCQKCGDRGFEVALIYCEKCKNYALHRYCLDVPPEDIFDEDITWFCEDCEPKIVKPTTIDKLVSLPSQLDDSMVNHHNKKVKKRRVKKKCNRMTLSRPKRKVQRCEGSPSKHEAEGSNNSDNGQTIGNHCGQVVEEQLNSSHDPSKSVKSFQIITSDPIEIPEHNYVAAQPIIDPIWRGSLSMFNKDFNIVSGLVAHLSSLACPKVCEEAELLPLLLFPELVHRTDVWPKAFEKCGPSDQSIALYFFPDNERDEKDFDSLVVSMIQDDLAMRAVLENAELLVFTSIILPEQYRRFQTKIYLWAVFRAKQFPQLTNDNAPGGEKNLAKPLTCYGQSPVSTLSNDVDISCGPKPLNSFCSSLR